jgi:hypothetical protein
MSHGSAPCDVTDEVQTLILKLKTKKIARNAKIGKDCLLGFARRSRQLSSKFAAACCSSPSKPSVSLFCGAFYLVFLVVLLCRRHKRHINTMMRPILTASALISLLSTVASFSVSPERHSRPYSGDRLGSSAPRREGMSMTIYRGIHT